MIIEIIGGLGEGKTVTGVALLRDYFKHKRILSNAHLAFPHKLVTFDEILHNIGNLDFYRDSVLFIDEISNVIDARRFSSKENIAFTRFISQVGKIDCDIILTTQILESQVDLRIRELGNIYIYCSKVDRSGQFRLFRSRIDGEIMIVLDIEIKVFGGRDIIKKRFFYDPSPYFRLYDTKQILYRIE